MKKNKTVLEILNVALGAIYDLEDGGESTGIPSYRGKEVDVERGLRGMAPVAVTWTTDRGNWMWDGVVATLRAMGVDPGKPVEE